VATKEDEVEIFGDSYPNKIPWDIFSLFRLKRFVNQGQKKIIRNYISKNPRGFSWRIPWKASTPSASPQATAFFMYSYCVLMVTNFEFHNKTDWLMGSETFPHTRYRDVWHLLSNAKGDLPTCGPASRANKPLHTPHTTEFILLYQPLYKAQVLTFGLLSLI
jgi:hypothetical protein